ncbi:hypothetical protein [Streptococcus sp. CSL10205-OR2]|uniref:hypothetical protein n=1 Tax=Streptococcus sp. CSL10205-OR2 TaxID=2980558 RepID=UPI0021D919B5|nr:hypothetical protein [Streptococcus sp. CSL10205-OR2]MCU9534321.1 hypothetical protein [Streptococcus sp. CSL10205-OR2]
MKAMYRGKEVDVWRVSRDSNQPDWVKQAFAKNYMRWVDNHVLILLAGLNPDTRANLKMGMTGSAGGGGFMGYYMYRNGYIGDYVDGTNHQVLSEKQFQKAYQVLSD